MENAASSSPVRGRGGSVWRGRGRGAARGGGGRGRGGMRGRGRGFHPRDGNAGAADHPQRRHKPRAGRKRERAEDGAADGVDAEEKERRQRAEAYFGVADAEGAAAGTAAGVSGSTAPAPVSAGAGRKTVSAFTALRTALVDAAAVAAYVRDTHASLVKKVAGVTDSKATNMFLQAMSHQPESLYAELMSTYKSEVVAVLERLFSLYALGKAPMTPQAHEFVIRCEQQGVRTAEWAAGGVRPLGEGAAEPSLLTPRELLKRLAARDPIGRLQRQIELSTDLDDVARCVARFASLQSKVDRAAAGEDGEDAGTELDYARRCQVISKLVSKTRRLLTEAPKDLCEMTPAGDGSGGEPAQGEAPAGPAEKQESRPIALTEEQRELVRSGIAHELLGMLLKVLDTRPPGSVSTPITKVVRFAEWCLAHELITQADHDAIQALRARTNEDLESQAVQLETVMTLKSLAADDDEGLRAVADLLWAEGEESRLEPNSVDTLSAIAVAASPPTISDDVKMLVFNRLVATQRYFMERGTPIHMPRRTMRFLNDVRNKERSEAVARLQRAETGSDPETAAHPSEATAESA